MFRSLMLLALATCIPTLAVGQAASVLSLEQALAAARKGSPDVAAASEAVAGARGRERQAGAFANPTAIYRREQTGNAGQASSQTILGIEQALELTGTVGARREAARRRREAAEARQAAAERQLDYEVTRAYALAVAAERRFQLTDRAAGEFSRAVDVSQQRLAAGDISAYAHRRMKLEAARYAALRAHAASDRRAARLGLLVVIAGPGDTISDASAERIALPDSLPVPGIATAPDSLRALALSERPDLRSAQLEQQAAEADARAASRERLPVPLVSLGFKSERVTGLAARLNGFAAGVSLALPLWNQGGGAVFATQADSRRRAIELEGHRRRVAREVGEAYEARQVSQREIEALAPQLGAESRAAVEAAQVAYAEGEISLLEWLDAVRAYHEAESTFATLLADVLIHHAALERAVGTSRVSP